MVGKRLVNTGGAAGAAAFDPLQNFETVTYTGNGGTQKITGYIRKGAAFNGSAYITTTPQTQQQEFSWSFWVNYTSTSLYSFIASVYTGSDVSGVPNALFINSQNSGRLALALGNNGSYIFNFNHTTTGLNDGNWHHVLVSWDGTTNTDAVKFYIDNVVTTATSSISAASLPNYSEFALGARAVDHIIPYTGSIDQVRIFNKALSQSEVDTLEAETYADPKKSTTDYFGDGSGVALYELDEDANDTGGVSGYIGEGGIFNGSSSYIDTGLRLNTTSVSVSLWVKTSDTNACFFGTNTTDNQNRLYLGVNGGNFWIGAVTTNINTVSASPLLDNEWHNVILTLDGSTAKYYLDGNSTPVSSASYSGGGLQDLNALIGTFQGSGGVSTQFLTQGSIDQVRVFNRALSTSNNGVNEIFELYNETISTSSTLDFFGDSSAIALYELEGTANDTGGTYNSVSATDIIYSYNGTPTNINFLGMAFQPDLVWTKSYAGLNWWHFIQDSVRGTTSALFSNRTDAAGTFTDAIQSFNSNGYTIGSTGSLNYDSSNDYVAWCFKGGGNSNTYNVDNTGYSTASDAGLSSANGTTLNGASVNTQAGFSIINYETNVNGDNRPAHGLTQEPELIIFKPYDTSSLGWYVMTKKIDGSLDFLFLNTDGVKIDTVNNEFINSTHFRTSFGTSWGSVIAYCFHSVDGYQKVGSYTGLGGTSGPLVDLGFEPRWIMIKGANTTGASNWFIWDYQRDIPNPNNSPLQPNTDATQLTNNTFVQVTFGATNFQVSSSAASPQINELNKTYIYLAIA